MEACASAVAGPVVERITNCTLDPIFRQVDYLVHYRSNVNDLRDRGKKLVESRDYVQHAVNSAKSNGEEIEAMVLEWLRVAEKFGEDVDEFFNEANGRSIRWWNMLSRHRFSRKATKLSLEVVKAIEEGRFERVSYRVPPQGIRTLKSSKRFEPFESRIPIQKEIIDALADANASVIVVHGMGGVGKTTLVEEVARLAMEGKHFDAVAMATVTQTPDLKRIQGEIADQLGLKFEEESELGRANRLRQRLEMEKKVLVVLDDVWAKLDLARIGISAHHKGCKILVTSRKDDMFFDEIGNQKNVKIDILSKKEARNFFNKMACDSVESNDSDPEMEAVATELADECAGLPLALATVAQALRGKGRPLWNDALQELKFPSQPNNYGVNREAYTSLKLSYKSLDRDETRSLFLLCSLFPEDYQINIKYLLMYAMGLGLLNGISSLAVARYRILSLVDELKTSYLLLDGADNDFVKMHDIVRDTAILIASKIKSKYLVRHGGVVDCPWPTPDEFKDYTAISLGCSACPDLPEFACPQLKFLLLVGKRSPLRIPESFFAHMQELRVLDLTGLCILQLPSSINQLVNLQTLCLDDCVLPDMSIVGELKRLEILSLRASDIVILPSVIGQLTNLKMLNLSNCSKLKVIPVNLISRLTGLCELYMDNTFARWNGGHINEGNINAGIAELNNLPRLTTLHIHIPDARILPRASLFRNLISYRILIGEGWDWSGKFETSKTLKLKLDRSFQKEDAIQALLENTEDLYLDELRSVKNILFSLDQKGFPKLKRLRVRNNAEIVTVVNSVNLKNPHSAFPLLESLFLKNMMNLGCVCRGGLPEMSFRNLKRIKVESCDRLKFVFPPLMGRCLIHLQKLEISECHIMKTIVFKSKETETQTHDDMLDEKNMIEFPELRSLILQHLRELTGFYCHESIAVPSTQVDSNETISTKKPSFHPLFNHEVSLPKLETLKLQALNLGKIWQDQLPASFSCVKNLTVEGCASIKYLMTITVARSLVHLERLEISNCQVMKALLISEDRDLDNHYTATQSTFQHENIFPSLETLVISRMDALETLWDSRATSGSFSKLKKVDIKQCKRLETVFPDYMLNRLMNLERLNVTDCNSVVEVFQVKGPIVNGEEVEDGAAHHLRELKLLRLPKLKHIWSKDPHKSLSFPSLQIVHTVHCQSLRNLFPASLAKGLVQLEELRIQFCGVEEIVAKGEDREDEDASFLFNGLTSLHLWNLFELKSFYPGKYTLGCPSLKLLDVRHCKSFKLLEGALENSLPADEKVQDQPSQRKMSERRESDVLDEMSTRKEEGTTTIHNEVDAQLTEISAQLETLFVGQKQILEQLGQVTAIVRGAFEAVKVIPKAYSNNSIDK